MGIPQGFQKARLEPDTGAPIDCALNPESYTVTKSNVWTFKPTSAEDAPKPEFGGGLPRVTHVQLLFDTTLLGPDQSVKGVTNDLLKLKSLEYIQARNAAAAQGYDVSLMDGAIAVKLSDLKEQTNMGFKVAPRGTQLTSGMLVR